MAVKYCTKANVQLGYDELQEADMDAIIDSLITESEEEIRSDLSGIVDVVLMDKLDPLPHPIKQMCIFKAREKSFSARYGSQIPERSQAQRYMLKYKEMLEGVKSGTIEISDSIKKQVQGGSVRFL